MEQLANDVITELAAGIDADDLTLTVTDATGLPATGNFRLWVGDPDADPADYELMLATARTGTTVTVTRGIEGTDPIDHAAGRTVAAVITSGALVAFMEVTQAELDAEATASMVPGSPR